MFSQLLLSVVLLQQLSTAEVKDQDFCLNGTINAVPAGAPSEVFIQYCTLLSLFSTNLQWFNLCAGGVGWTPTLATVVCRELPGYSDQGAQLGGAVSCDLQETGSSFVLNQPCTGSENSLRECGGVTTFGGGSCQCAKITCQPADSGPTEAVSSDSTTRPSTPTTDSGPTETVSSDITEMDLTTMGNTTSVIVTNQGTPIVPQNSVIIPLVAVVGVLVVLLVVAVIIVCFVFYKRRKSANSCSDPPTEGNECYSLHPRGYDDETKQPNSSLSPTYEVVANVDKEVHTYDVIGSSSDPLTGRNESYSLHHHEYNDETKQPNSSLGPTYEVVGNVDKEVHSYL